MFSIFFLKFWPTCVFSDVGQAYLPFVEQTIIKKCWLWKCTYWAVIMVKSVKVPQSTFLYLGVSKSNNFHWFITVGPWSKCLTAPILKKGISRLFLLFLRIWIYRMNWIEPCGNCRQLRANKKNRTR